MKDKIISKLEQHAETLLSKDNLAMDDVNFLIFWMNRLENQEAQEAYKAQEEERKAAKAESDKALRENMYAMIDRTFNS